LDENANSYEIVGCSDEVKREEREERGKRIELEKYMMRGTKNYGNLDVIILLGQRRGGGLR